MNEAKSPNRRPPTLQDGSVIAGPNNGGTATVLGTWIARPLSFISAHSSEQPFAKYLVQSMELCTAKYTGP